MEHSLIKHVYTIYTKIKAAIMYHCAAKLSKYNTAPICEHFTKIEICGVSNSMKYNIITSLHAIYKTNNISVKNNIQLYCYQYLLNIKFNQVNIYQNNE